MGISCTSTADYHSSLAAVDELPDEFLELLIATVKPVKEFAAFTTAGACQTQLLQERINVSLSEFETLSIERLKLGLQRRILLLQLVEIGRLTSLASLHPHDILVYLG